MKSIEKTKNLFVLASIDNTGRTCYLRSLHEPGKWEIVADIEIATKYTTDDAAQMSYDFYVAEMGADAGAFAIIPVEIVYSLINEE